MPIRVIFTASPCQSRVSRYFYWKTSITPFMLRRTKALVASELPPKVEALQRVELSGTQSLSA
jgi:SNF2 family DNA or RNA helicase